MSNVSRYRVTGFAVSVLNISSVLETKGQVYLAMSEENPTSNYGTDRIIGTDIITTLPYC